MPKLRVAPLMIVFGAFCSLIALAPLPAGVLAQQPPASIRQHITIGAARRPCDPAEIKSFSLGKGPPESVLEQVEVRSNSAKRIAAIKLAWRVYAAVESRKAAFESCESELSAPILASGSTDVIPVTYLEPKASVTIAINPLPVVNGTENHTAFIDRPLVTVDDLRPLIAHGKPVAPGKYGLVIFVSEVQYTDGTAWASPLR